MEEKEIKEIAEQLRCPSGEKGSQVATILEESNAYMVNQTINSLGKIKDLTLLELGPGNGYHLANILENCQKAYTVEISDLMYQKIEKRFSNEISTGVLINLLGDGKTINIPNDIVDKAFTVNTIYFWSNPKKYLSEIGKCMKQGGDLFITYVHKRSAEKLPFSRYGFELYDEDKIENLCKSSEFHVRNQQHFFDNVQPKIGDMIARNFIVANLCKI